MVLSRCEKSWASCLTLLEEEDHYPLSLMNQLLLGSQSSAGGVQGAGAFITPGSPLTDLEEDDISPPPLLFQSSSDMDEDVITIHTQFDPGDPLNKQPPFQNRDPDFILEWTRKEREKAEKAYVIDNMDDLEQKVGNFGEYLSLRLSMNPFSATGNAPIWSKAWRSFHKD